MALRRLVLGILAGGAALILAAATPASAEFFGCKEPHTKITYSSGYFPHQYSSRRYTDAYAYQRSRHVTTYSATRTARHYRSDRWR